MNCEKSMVRTFSYDNWYQKDPNDYYVLHKRMYKKYSYLSGILLMVCLILTVGFGVKLNTIKPGGQKVSVNIASVDRGGNKVYVTYNDTTEELINVNDSEVYRYAASCTLGRTMDVFLGEDGKFYSNVQGIKNNTAIGKLYFASLFSALGLIIFTAVLYAFVVEAIKHENRD